MKKYKKILVLTLILFFFFTSTSYAMEEKTIVILVDELNFKDIENIFPEKNIGLGLMNINPRDSGDESLYFSLATGRKLGVKSNYYNGLQRDEAGNIEILGFKNMLRDIEKTSRNINIDLLGEELKDQGISYIGEDSSAIIAGDKDGKIQSGEIQINYDEKWLKEKTSYYLKDSNVLILAYDHDNKNSRIKILENYVDEFKNQNIMLIPKSVDSDMQYIFNRSLAPFLYSNGRDQGLLTSSSTQRKSLVAVEDVYVELLALNDKESQVNIGNRIEIHENPDNIKAIENIFIKNINLLWLAYIYHGLVYLLQIYIVYSLFRKKRHDLDRINNFNNFIIVNIFISLLMGASDFHINLFLYLFVNILMTYLITEIVVDRDVNVIGLFSSLTYGLIVVGAIFFPDTIYNSYIGFNNLFYGARYYGFNNGIMGVFLVTSVISYFFTKELFLKKSTQNLLCLFYFSANIIILSANYGANTGGFLTALVLLLTMVFTNVLDKNISIRNVSILIGIGLLIFSINMYFDKMSSNQGHAIKFLSRIRSFGISEFLDMAIVKGKALIKLTLLPPFSLVIISQIFSLKKLLEEKNGRIKEAYIIIFISLVGFLINDTGMIFFIYMINYLIALLIYKNLQVDIKNNLRGKGYNNYWNENK